MRTNDADWVVYRLKSGWLQAITQKRWDGWKVRPEVIKDLVAEVVAEGLTEDEALRFVALTREE
jgi:hypothetical protein